MAYGAARVCKGINLRGCEVYATVPNTKGEELFPESGSMQST